MARSVCAGFAGGRFECLSRVCPKGTVPGMRIFWVWCVLGSLMIPFRANAELLHSWSAEGDALDSVGMSDGTLIGGTTYGPGFLGQGFLFDGVDSAVTFGADDGDFGTSDFTIAFAISAASPQGIQQILSNRGSCFVGSFWDIRTGGSGTLGIEIFESNVNTGLNTGVDVLDGLFHTVVVTRSGTVVTAYVDGINVARRDSGLIANLSNSAPLSVSAGPCVGLDGTVPFEGTIDEIRLANTAEPYLLLGDFDCGDGALNGDVTATDALAALLAAVGSGECPLCVCDVNDSGSITASDSLAILQFSIGQPVPLTCPDCEF